jgi:hypothetical protein
MLRSHRTRDLAFNLKIVDCATKSWHGKKERRRLSGAGTEKLTNGSRVSSFALLPILIPFVHAVVLQYHIFYI